MFKRVRWSRVAIIIIFITIISIGMNYFIEKQSEAVVQEQEEDEIISSVEETTLSEFPGLQLRTATTESNKFTTSLSIPVAENAELNEPIQQWITEQKVAFDAETKENDEWLSLENRAHLNIQLETKKVTEHIYSLVFSAYSYTGGANGVTTVQTFTIDVENNRLLQLGDVIELNDDALADIRKLLLEELEKDAKTFIYVVEKYLDEALSNTEGWKWSLSKKSLTLYFDEYEIAAGAAGKIKVKLPLEQLNSFLNEKIANELKIPMKEEKQEQLTHEFRELDSKGKYVALTFDDGPSAKVTPQVLAILKKYGARATFFMLGSQVDYYPDLVKQVAMEGHEIGNHSNSHPDLTKLSGQQLKQQIAGTNKKIKELVGKEPTALRPPYGAFNDHVKAAAQENNMSIVLWSVDSVDWKNRNAKTINQIIQRDVASGSVVLMHDIHPTTADALPELLAGLQKEGYEFVTVSELLSLEKDREVAKPYYGKAK